MQRKCKGVYWLVEVEVEVEGPGFIERKTGIVTPRVWDRDTLRPAGHHDTCPETLEWTERHHSAR